MSRRVLLTVSGAIPDGLAADVEAGRRPRVDHLELAEAIPADVVDLSMALVATGRTGRLVHRLAGAGAAIAWAAFRRRADYDVILTDGEQVGIPLGVMLSGTRRPPRHAMIVHILSVPKKSIPFRLLGLRRRIDLLLVYASAQARFAIERLGVAADAVVLTPFQVDTTFFRPCHPATTTSHGATDTGRRLICSAGLERRDYPTLVAAVGGLDVDVVIAAASPWSRRRDSSADTALPPNVTVRRLDLASLRDLYARADLVVVPLEETDFQAGITTILEAMAMAKPVICTRTPGQVDTIDHDQTGRYVPPGDPARLRQAIETLLADPAEARRLGTAARIWAVRHADIDVYCRNIAGHVAALVAGAGRG